MDDFTKRFWIERLEMYRNDRNNEIAVIDGRFYSIADENSKYFRGFSGHKFVIEFFNGTKKTTTNLWHGGDVPEEFQYLITNNAKFTKES